MNIFHINNNQIFTTIKRYQISTELSINRKTFQRLVLEILKSFNQEYNIQAGAISALQEATESYLVNLFEDINLHTKRKTIIPEDIINVLAKRIREKPSEVCKKLSKKKEHCIKKCVINEEDKPISQLISEWRIKKNIWIKKFGIKECSVRLTPMKKKRTIKPVNQTNLLRYLNSKYLKISTNQKEKYIKIILNNLRKNKLD